ncbi:MAG: hypothetical protein IAG13_25180 [Deltaproteobacteria bacterium]|nr:hypothetical protein [Nannocystaceae bacterium]
MMTACGYADGDPIVGGDAGTTGAASGSGTGTGTSATADPGSSSTGEPARCGCEDLEPGDRCLRFVNACDAPIWIGASGEVEPADAFDGLGMLAPQACVAIGVHAIAGGRAYGRTDCVDQLCTSDGGAGRGTLVQLALPADGIDTYDVSLVDGFNLPMAMAPVGFDPRDLPAGVCRAASCAADLRVACGEGLARTNDDGDIAWCESICRACGACEACDDCSDPAAPACTPCGATASTCCSETRCASNAYTELWKSLCPDAITYSGEGTAFTCDRRSDFDIVFCP